MKIETKFSNGDVVYWIHQEKRQEFIPCEFCAGRGVINGADETERVCPECYRRGGKTIYKEMHWKYVRSMNVGQVRVEITKSEGVPGEEVFDNYKPQSNREEQYMCNETGIGSGTLYNAEDLFATKGEAETECIIRNAEDEVEHANA